VNFLDHGPDEKPTLDPDRPPCRAGGWEQDRARWTGFCTNSNADIPPARDFPGAFRPPRRVPFYAIAANPRRDLRFPTCFNEDRRDQLSRERL